MGILLPSNPCLRSYGFESSPGCIQGKGRGNCPFGNQTRAKACSGQAVRNGSDTATHQALAALRHWPLRMARSPVRITSWSSAIRMRVMSFPHTLNSSRNHQAPDLGKPRNRLRRYLSCPARQGRVARSLSDPCRIRVGAGNTCLIGAYPALPAVHRHSDEIPNPVDSNRTKEVTRQFRTKQEQKSR